MHTYLWIAVGSALGGMARHWCSFTIANATGGAFPWGTLLVNVVGSCIIGFIASLTWPDGRFVASSTAGQFLMVGVLGGFTTFSAFSLQTLNLMQTGHWAQAGLYIASSVLLCLVAVWLGYLAGAYLNTLRWA